MANMLKNLQFANVKPPVTGRAKPNLVDRARDKFMRACDEQLLACEAAIDGKNGFTVLKKRYVKGEDGKEVLGDKAVKVRPWWFEEGGIFYVAPRYSNKIVEIQKGKPSIPAGDALKNVLRVLEVLREAAGGGELDKPLEVISKDAQARLAKGKSA